MLELDGDMDMDVSETTTPLVGRTDKLEVLYGINPVLEALKAGRRRFGRALLETGAAATPRMKRLVAAFARAGVPVDTTDRGRLFQACNTKEHQGVVLEVGIYPYVPAEQLLDRPRLLMPDNIEDPQNLGAILRSAEVFGWAGIMVPDKGVPLVYPSVVKASAGASEHLFIARDRHATAYLRLLLEHKYTVVAIDEDGREDLDALSNRIIGPIALVVGGEHKSVGQFILNSAHHVAAIRQRGRIGSLNASVAAGIAMHALAEPAAQAPVVEVKACSIGNTSDHD